MKSWVLIGLVLAVSACSNTDKELTSATANQAQQEAVAQNGEALEGQEVAKVEQKRKVKCEYVKNVGSNMKRKVCKSVDYENKQRDAAWEYMMRSQGRVQGTNN